MYQHILIPTDGSELAERAVTRGLSLAKFLGAAVTVIIVEEPVPTGWWSVAENRLADVADITAKYDEEIKKTQRDRARSGGQCGQAGRCALRYDPRARRATL